MQFKTKLGLVDIPNDEVMAASRDISSSAVAACDPAGTVGSLAQAAGSVALEQIANYLGNGGLFNPEMMEHDKVRDMVLLCRHEIKDLSRRLENQRSRIAAYATAADGLLTQAEQARIPGSGMDGYRDARNLRAIIAGLNDQAHPQPGERAIN